MTEIFADLFQRLTKEASVTVAGARESVLAISERVNRKTQTLRLHWHAATIRHQMESVYRTLGQTLCDVADPAGPLMPMSAANSTHTHARVRDAAAAVQLLKRELGLVEAAIRDLEV